MKVPHWLLKQRQGYSLELKIELTQAKIKEWYEHWDGMVYVAFSGGKDSTVLLHLVREMYPEVPAIFSDTGLEYPEIREFVRGFDNVAWLRPKKNFRQVISEYGYPVISKVVSKGIDRYTNTKSELQKTLRLYGGINPTSGKKQYADVPKKWHILTNAPFKVSDRCCYYLKKAPLDKYARESKRKAMVGIMAGEGYRRQLIYMNNGCNAFDSKKPKSMPIAFWLDEDIWKYIDDNNIRYCKVYDMGESHTGCIFCAFGAHLEPEPNRFQRLRVTHPKLWKYCMDKLDMRTVLDYIGVSYK